MKIRLIVLFTFLVSMNLISVEPELYSDKTFKLGNEQKEIIKHNNIAYLVMNDEVYEYELWAMNGEKNQLIMLMDINTKGRSNPKYISTELESRFLFAATDTISGGLWATNGTPESTVFLKRINYKAISDYKTNIKYNDKIYFSVLFENSNVGIASTDGTSEGTRIIIDSIGAKSESDLKFYEVNGRLLLSVNYSKTENVIYKVEEERNRLQRLANDVFDLDVEYEKPIVIGNKLLFVRLYGKYMVKQLCSTDGTQSGTIGLTDTNRGTDYIGISSPNTSIMLNNKLLFNITPGGTTTEIWVTDGTLDSTYAIVDESEKLNNQYLFKGQDGFNKITIHISNQQGNIKILRTDGTIIGTSYSTVYHSGSINFKELSFITKDKLYFFSKASGNPYELYVLDLEKTEKTLLKRIESIENFITPILIPHNIDNKFVWIESENIFFNAIYCIDDNDKVVRLKEEDTFRVYSDYSTAINGEIYMYLSDTLSTYLWKSDLTVSGSEVIEYNIRPEYISYDGSLPIFELNGYIYFFANYYSHYNNYKLYRIKTTLPTSVSSPSIEPTELTIYPNPVNDKLHVEIDKPTNLSLMDITGRIIKEIQLNNSSEIDISKLSSGVYFLTNESGSVVSKFVKD